MGFIRTIASFASWLVGLYSTLIIVRVIISWVRLFGRGPNTFYYENQEPTQSPLENIDSILGKIVDPYLNVFKSVSSLRRGGIDFTPLLALVCLNLVKSILGIIAQAGSITLWLVIAIIISGLWSVFSFIMVTMLIMMIVRYIVGRTNQNQNSQIINFIDPIINSPVSFVYKAFYKNKGQVEDQKLVLTAFIFYLVLYLALSAVKSGLISLLLSL